MREQLFCEQNHGPNVVDQYAMAVKEDSCITVERLPQKIAVLKEEVR